MLPSPDRRERILFQVSNKTSMVSTWQIWFQVKDDPTLPVQTSPGLLSAAKGWHSPALTQAKPPPSLHPFWAEILRQPYCAKSFTVILWCELVSARDAEQTWTGFTEGSTWIPWSESLVLLRTELPLFVLNQILNPMKWKNAHFVFSDLLKLNASHNQQGLWN